MKVLLTLLSSFMGITILAQELPPLQNFALNDYKADNQNWSITQASNKLIYVANNDGVLEFNGAAWNLYPTPNGSITRSVKAVDDKVYSGCYMDFGFWTKNDLGSFEYTSISENLDITLIEDEEFWNIANIDDWVLFQSLDRIYIYHTGNNSVTIIDSDTTIVKMYTVGNSIYFQRLNQGIYKIENGMDVLVTDLDIAKNQEVVNIYKRGQGMLLQTREKGFYLWTGGSIKQWENNSTELLNKVSVYSSTRLRDNSFAIGTISDGLIHLDANGDPILQIDSAKGLLNNTVLALFEDMDHNIWLGLDNGISFINVKSPIKEYNDVNGKIGSVYTSAVFKGKLYLGSNQGLFYRNQNSTDEFRLIKGTEGQVWNLKVLDDTLFCGHHLGTFIINGTNADLISSFKGTWDIKRSKNEDLLLQGGYDGLYVLKRADGSWKVSNKIKNFHNSSMYFVEMPNNEIFVNHEYKGVFKLKINDDYTEALEVTTDSLIKGSNSSILEYNQDLLYAYGEGIFKFDRLGQRFIKDTLLSKVYNGRGKKEFISGKLVLDPKTNNLWSFSKSYLSYVSPGEISSTPKINRIPLNMVNRKAIIGYENIIQWDDNNKYLLGNYAGFITMDLNKIDFKDFDVAINRISKNNRSGAYQAKSFLDKDQKAKLKNDESTIEISFYTPEYNKYFKPEYQYQLEGIYDDWSGWSGNASEQFENLPYGDYIFKVRSRIGDKISSNTASYSFSVARPWYATKHMIALYIVAMALFLFLMHTLYRRYYKKKQKKLIKRKNRELRLAQVENEKEIIRIKNEQLQREFKSKSKELAASTMNIVKKNELLTSIKNELVTIKNNTAVKPILKIIDKNLRKNDDWEFFQEAFNLADQDFLQKVKTIHPNLTPNDLRLCAYLRLNLSSKEIAPLLNISTRSVEVKRYRLRKKMSLPHKNNLAEYILNL